MTRRDISKTDEIILGIVLKKFNNHPNDQLCVGGLGVDLDTHSYAEFPKYVSSIVLRKSLENLEDNGILASHSIYISGEWVATLTPDALTYFQDKEDRQKAKESAEGGHNSSVAVYGNINNINGSIAIGAGSYSNLCFKRSFEAIERQINEQGGDDKEALRACVADIKNALEEIRQTGQVPRNVLNTSVIDLLDKHGWLSGVLANQIVNLIINMLSSCG